MQTSLGRAFAKVCPEGAVSGRRRPTSARRWPQPEHENRTRSRTGLKRCYHLPCASQNMPKSIPNRVEPRSGQIWPRPPRIAEHRLLDANSIPQSQPTSVDTEHGPMLTALALRSHWRSKFPNALHRRATPEYHAMCCIPNTCKEPVPCPREPASSRAAPRNCIAPPPPLDLVNIDPRSGDFTRSVFQSLSTGPHVAESCWVNQG